MMLKCTLESGEVIHVEKVYKCIRCSSEYPCPSLFKQGVCFACIDKETEPQPYLGRQFGSIYWVGRAKERGML